MSNSFYIFVESLRNTYEAGGVVMLPILIAGVIGFYFLFSSWFRIGRDFFRKDIHRVIKRMRLDLKCCLFRKYSRMLFPQITVPLHIAFPAFLQRFPR